MENLMKETYISSDDIIRTFISRRVHPLQRRAHKISEMYGPRDPTKITGLPLSKEDIVLKAKERFPRIAAEKRGPRQKRDLDEEDPDPYIHWTDLKMGRTHTSRPDAPSAGTQPQVHEHAAPLQAEVGREFLKKLTSQGKKNKAPAPEVGSSQGPPAKRSRTEVVGGKEVGKKRYRGKQMPVASGKKKKTAASPSKSVPASSAPASSTPGQDAPDARSPPKTSPTPPPEAPTFEPTGATPTPPPNQGPIAAEPAPSPSQGPAVAKPTPPPEGTKPLKPEPFKGKAMASGTPTSGSQHLVLHAGRAAVAAGEAASGQLGQITELKRGGNELGHLLEYAEKWNRVDVSAATRGLGKDRLPAIDPAGPRCTEQHFMRLRRAVKELDNAWHNATNNVVLSRKPPLRPSRPSSAPFKTLGEKEQLIQEHRKALDAQELISSGLKDQLIQFGLRHDQEMKDAKAAAEAKLNEVLEDSTNSTAVLRLELEEGGKARKAAEDQAALLEAEQKEYDQLGSFRTHRSHACGGPESRRSPDVAIRLFKVLWPGEEVPANLTLTSERLKGASRRIREWQWLGARAGADEAIRIACSWYEDLDLEAFHTMRQDAPTDTDPILTAKRKDRAYRIAEYAAVRTFIPPPPGVTDYLSDFEEEDDDEDAGEDDALPDGGDAPPEAPDAGDVPP
nr:uncharacterized protein LOC127347295 [Lolium perenne]